MADNNSVSEMVIIRGHVPLVEDDNGQAGEGWLRVAPAYTGDGGPYPSRDFFEGLTTLDLTVSQARAAEQPGSYDERPVNFVGQVMLGGSEVNVVGIHFRSGRVRGFLSMMDSD